MSRVTFLVTAAAIAALAIAPVVAQKPGQAQTLLEAAKQKETLQGDLAGAIKQYQSIVDQFSKTDRAAAAQALVAIAECYRKLGDTQARAVYERIVREFGDQKEAATLARARLGATAAPAGGTGMVNMQKWTGPKVDPEGTVSPDGRYLSFVDWETGDLALHDLTTGTDRRLTNKGTWSQSLDFAEESAISRDGLQIAYAWFVDAQRRYQIRLQKLNDTSSARTLVDDPDIVWIAPYDWTPDGRTILVSLARRNRTAQIATIDVTGGSLRILKTVEGHTGRLFFSPDGALIAYDMSPGQALDRRDVFVVSSDGRREIPAVVHPAFDELLGWSPDGRFLLFASDRAGSPGVWGLPFANGSPQGAPVFLKDLGSQLRESVGVTRTGSLYYGVQTQARGLRIMSIDFETGKALSAPVQPFESYSVENVAPDWSSDGKYLVYSTQERPGAGFAGVVSILTVDTGEIRHVRPALGQALRPRWTPDGSLIVQGRDFDRRPGIYRVDPWTGVTSPLVVGSVEQQNTPTQSSLSSDGKLLFYHTDSTEGVAIVERNLVTGNVRELLRRSHLFGLSLSPDDRELTFIELDWTAKTSTLNTLDTHTGQIRELFRVNDPVALVNFADWTPDGKRIVFGQSQGLSNSAWMIPRIGGTPVRLDLPAAKLAAMNNPRIHPDGRRVAYVSGEPKWEVWALENFLPPGTASKK